MSILEWLTGQDFIKTQERQAELQKQYVKRIHPWQETPIVMKELPMQTMYCPVHQIYYTPEFGCIGCHNDKQEKEMVNVSGTRIEANAERERQRLDREAIDRVNAMSGLVRPEKAPAGEKGGATKLDIGKAPIDQGVLDYFPRALAAVAGVSQFGFEKYKEWGGWRDVPNGLARYRNAKGRHLLDGKRELRASDSKLLHAAHEAWNALAVLELMLYADEPKSMEKTYEDVAQKLYGSSDRGAGVSNAS